MGNIKVVSPMDGFPVRACWELRFFSFDWKYSEKGAKNHFTVDPAKRNAYKHLYTSATTDR